MIISHITITIHFVFSKNHPDDYRYNSHSLIIDSFILSLHFFFHSTKLSPPSISSIAIFLLELFLPTFGTLLHLFYKNGAASTYLWHPLTFHVHVTIHNTFGTHLRLYLELLLPTKLISLYLESLLHILGFSCHPTRAAVIPNFRSTFILSAPSFV